MYNVFYSQRTSEGVARQTVSFEKKEEAFSRFHTELAQVGVSTTLIAVSAMVFTDECNVLKSGYEVVELVAEEPQEEQGE